VYTGAGGGGTVSATNTIVLYGSFFGNSDVINGGGTGNTFPDLTIGPATPTITWATPADITYGTALGAAQLDATTRVPGTFVYTRAPGTVPPAGPDQTLSVTFIPTDTVDFNSVTTTVPINVAKAHLTVAANDQSMTYGSSVPALTDTITGLVNGDDASVISG